MSLPSWLRSWRSALARASSVNRRRRHKKRFAPTSRVGVERLEDRTLPALTFGSAFPLAPPPGQQFGSSWARDVTTDPAGNVYITGMFNGTVDFDPARPSTDGVLQGKNNTQDTFVAKYAADGAFQWARRMGGD